MKDLLVGQECYTWACRNGDYVVLHGVIKEKNTFSIAFDDIGYLILVDGEDDTIARMADSVFDTYDACKKDLILLLQKWSLDYQQELIENRRKISELERLSSTYKQQIKRLEEQQ